MLDSVDEKLIQLLAKDARQTSKALATQLNVNPTTVRRRLMKLIRSGVIRIAALADPIKVGLPLITVIAFDVARHGLESAVQMLANQPEVKWVSTTTGRFDILVLAAFHSTDELTNFVQGRLANMEGLRDTETFICLQVGKERYMQL